MQSVSHLYRRIPACLVILAGLILFRPACLAQQSATAPGPDSGIGRWLPGARGIVGTVSAATPSSFQVSLDDGAMYTVHFSANTRILQQPGRRDRSAIQAGNRPRMHTIEASNIHPGDTITAIGEVDDVGKSVGSVVIVRLSRARAARLRKLEASYGKTWLAGSITAVQGQQITILGAVDRMPHTITVDGSTTYQYLREPVAFTDLHPGEMIRIAGAGQNGEFSARKIRVMPSHRRQARQMPSAPPQ